MLKATERMCLVPLVSTIEEDHFEILSGKSQTIKYTQKSPQYRVYCKIFYFQSSHLVDPLLFSRRVLNLQARTYIYWTILTVQDSITLEVFDNLICDILVV